MDNRPVVLVADADRRIRDLLRRALPEAGFRVLVSDPQGALEASRSGRPDVVLLDCSQMTRGTADLVTEIRDGRSMGVIGLGEAGMRETAATSLDAGADDVVLKPLALGELAARIRAVMRRGRGRLGPPRIMVGDVEVDMEARTLRRDGKAVAANRIEFQLVEHLVSHRGQVLSHAELLTAIWGADHRDEVALLRIWMGRVRRLLGTDATGGAIRTVPGVGYCFDPDGEFRRR